MLPTACNKPGPPDCILEPEKVPFDNAKYKANDEVSGIIVAPFTGDRDDISAEHVYQDGVWTVVISRKLVTNSEFDVQFNDTKQRYAFGLLIFDNAQVRHAYHTGVLQMTLE